MDSNEALRVACALITTHDDDMANEMIAQFDMNDWIDIAHALVGLVRGSWMWYVDNADTEFDSIEEMAFEFAQSIETEPT